MECLECFGALVNLGRRWVPEMPDSSGGEERGGEDEGGIFMLM